MVGADCSKGLERFRGVRKTWHLGTNSGIEKLCPDHPDFHKNVEGI